MKTQKMPFKKGVKGYFETTASLDETLKQNIRMLISTEPGSRIMELDYGAGLRQFLFEPNDEILKIRIKGFLEDKFRKYLQQLNTKKVEIEFEDNSFMVTINFVFREKEETIKYRVR